MDFSGGVKHWDKCKLRTALEWVVFTSRRTARLELTKTGFAAESGQNDEYRTIDFHILYHNFHKSAVVHNKNRRKRNEDAGGSRRRSK